MLLIVHTGNRVVNSSHTQYDRALCSAAVCSEAIGASCFSTSRMSVIKRKKSADVNIKEYPECNTTISWFDSM